MRAPIARGANESLINKIFYKYRNQIKDSSNDSLEAKIKTKQYTHPPPKKERKQNGKEMKIGQ